MIVARWLTVGAWLCALLAVVALPIVLGPVGMALGLAAHKAGDRLGMSGAVAAAAGMVVGFVLIVLLT